MAKAAVPSYLGAEFPDVPPGHKFTLYGAFWEPDQGWKRIKNIDPHTLRNDFGHLPREVVRLRDALSSRQLRTATTLGSAIWTIEANSVAPFVTGTGIEHPLENGMAFLSPYGLPYLPGSSIKGVLRRAAEELVGGDWGDPAGWDQPAIDALFGDETGAGNDEAGRTRGALIFWDVFPRCDRLKVEIMNPHYGDYYQGKTTPADCGSPIPIYFLTVPEQSDFTFHVQCNLTLLTDDLGNRWKDLLQAGFGHAFDWLGFGAKTAVGYGQMRVDENAARERLEQEQRARDEALRQAEFAKLSQVEKDMRQIESSHKDNPAMGLFHELTSDRWASPEDQGAVARRIKELFEADGRWNPEFAGTNKQKVKQKDRCLKILEYLEGR